MTEPDTELLKDTLAEFSKRIESPIIILCASDLVPSVTLALAELKLSVEKRHQISVVDSDYGWIDSLSLADAASKLKADVLEFGRLAERVQFKDDFKPQKPKHIGKKGLNSARNRVICKGAYC